MITSQTVRKRSIFSVVPRVPLYRRKDYSNGGKRVFASLHSPCELNLVFTFGNKIWRKSSNVNAPYHIQPHISVYKRIKYIYMMIQKARMYTYMYIHTECMQNGLNYKYFYLYYNCNIKLHTYGIIFVSGTWNCKLNRTFEAGWGTLCGWMKGGIWGQYCRSCQNEKGQWGSSGRLRRVNWQDLVWKG